MTQLSLAEVDELFHLHRLILNCSVLMDQLLEREIFQGESEAPPNRNVGETMRDALAELLDDITDAARRMATIVNRDDAGGAT
jgi:hypothetical protein